MAKKTTKADLAANLAKSESEGRRLHREVMQAEARLDVALDNNLALKKVAAELTDRVARLEGYCHRVHELEDREMVMDKPAPETTGVAVRDAEPDYHHQSPRPIHRHRPAEWGAEMLRSYAPNREEQKEWWQL